MLPQMKSIGQKFFDILKTPVFLFNSRKDVCIDKCIVLFPFENSRLNCGLSGIISFKNLSCENFGHDKKISEIQKIFQEIVKFSFFEIQKNDNPQNYLSGLENAEKLLQLSRDLKEDSLFSMLFINENSIKTLNEISAEIKNFSAEESLIVHKKLGIFPPEQGIKIISILEKIKDAQWTLEKEILENIEKIKILSKNTLKPQAVSFYRRINTVLNSINILEVRGRDSAGISIFITYDNENYEKFLKKLTNDSLEQIFNHRKNITELSNYKITIDKDFVKPQTTVVFTYKYAAETGALGDNISFIRNQIKNDFILKAATETDFLNATTGAHTRWASVGEISQQNCHPVDNFTKNRQKNTSGLIHVCLNGDIDNYRELKDNFEKDIDLIPENITTDTKIIPLQISRYYNEGNSIEEAFRLAVCDFKGSHAILMQTDLSPGKVFLAQKGSGQAVFVGISEDSYTIASEVYGFVERTQDYYKLEGEKYNGQIVILDDSAQNKIEGITSFTYSGQVIHINEDLIQNTEITTRDVDRQDFDHFFLKEIFESPSSVRKTIQGRWKLTDLEQNLKKVVFDEFIFPEKIKNAFSQKQIKRIFFIGQGTAGIAANASSFMVSYYLNRKDIQISALKASELSGFILDENKPDSMSDSLVVAITQSGTTTDTNKSIDMAKKCGAKTMAIVNRRDSDITFKVDGVLYTSTGRDIEMSVASTKAFYSQVTAGALLGLYLADLLNLRDDIFISNELDKLSALPELMEKILSNKQEIKEAAENCAYKKTYWASVGSGPNKAASDEIRIKLSELCYRTISSDYVEDKKHIDLSSEPLILVCAAGARESVLSDIIKDNAIFKAHKSTTIVFAGENDSRFDKDSDAVIRIPETGENLSPVLVTLAGHLWGYYAAKSINEDSKFFYRQKKQIQETISSLLSQDKELFEVILEKEFKESIASFYKEFRKRQNDKNFFAILPSNFTSDLVLILNYLYGRLNASDFDMDFQVKGTPANMTGRLFDMLSNACDLLSRPIDAIKHQAKTVTVGTSRISEKPSGIVFEALLASNISFDQITPQNLVVIKNLQEIVDKIKGYVLYKIDDLNLLGEPVDETKISVLEKSGSLKEIPSRADTDNTLKGTKKIIVKEGNVFIGRGQKDGRSILVIPAAAQEGTIEHKRIEYLLSIEIGFKKEVPLYLKTKALGGKLERIKNNVQENNIKWNNSLINLLSTEELFGLSYEKIVEKIVEKAAV
ncbi:MAG: SIS domain-containing protein [Desulfobacteraceae bacterium]|nr:SIS domain-containing protein [Desulfobacteraceae bacterium]